MKITTIQSQLLWEDITNNLHNLEEKIGVIKGKTDLIVLPEMFSTGFSMHPEKIAEPMEGRTLAWLRAMAQRTDAALVGSSMVSDNGQFYNRLFFVFPDGHYEYYDKKHLFSLAGEHTHYTAGARRLIVEWRDYRICPLICYDLRFPEWSRNTTGYDLLIYVANWPKPRANAWKALLNARAIENQCFVAGVNIIGEDANSNHYQGDTMIVDYLGNHLYDAHDRAEVATTRLDMSEMQVFRQKFPFLKDME